MPTTPNRSKKALQEIARVFNKLASELTADLNQAVREIENLRREVQHLKNASKRTGKPFPATHRKTSRTGHTTKIGSGTHGTGPHGSHRQPHSETPKPSHESSSYVFPHEPFNPPTPPEPSAPGGNN